MYDDNAYNSDRDQQFTALLNAGHLQQAMELLEAWHAGEPWNGEVLMRMAVVHWMAGEPARTLRDLDAYLQMDPENAEALARRAQALLMLGKREDAEASLVRAEAIDPLTPGVLLNRALLREERSDFTGAVESLTAYLEQIPTDHLALARRSHLYRQLGDYQRSLDDALACVTMHPEDPEAHFAEALARVTLEQGAEALAACDRCLQAQPAFLPALRLKIDLLADLGRLDEADADLAQLLAHDPDSPNSSLLRARISTERADFDAALTWMNRFLDDAPDEAHGYYRRGMIYFRMGDFPRALADFQEYTRQMPAAVEGYEQQFMCYLELNRLDEAVEVGSIAAKLQPQNYRVHYNLAYVDLRHGHLAKAAEGFCQALILNPDNEELMLRIYLAYAEHAGSEARQAFLRKATGELHDPTGMLHGLLAESYLEAGQPAAVLSLTDAILQEHADRPFGYLLRIKALCLLDRYDEAQGIADRGVAVLPEEGQLRLARSLVLRDTGHPNEALQELEEAERLLPNDPEVFRQRALVFGSVGQVEDAVHLLEQAIRLDGESADTYFWLSYFLIHCRRYAEAVTAANHLLELLPQSADGHLMRGVAWRGLRQDAKADADIELARQQEPGLSERLSVDPVIAALLAPQQPAGMTDRAKEFLRRAFRKAA